MCARRNQRKPAGRAEDSGEAQGEKVKAAKPVDFLGSFKPMRLVRQVLNNPDLGYQVMVVLLALTSNNVKMDRRINTMSSSLDNLRNAAEILGTSVQSLKNAAEAPRQIRNLLK